MHIRKSKDGYVGYKTAMAMVQENDVPAGTIENKGLIDFRGEHSMGQYVYLPEAFFYRRKRDKDGNVIGKEQITDETGKLVDKKYDQVNSSIMLNAGEIYLSGKESYGMKVAAFSDAKAKMINEKSGKIYLRKNPDGVDTADNSVGMALMQDASVEKGVVFHRGNAVNEGSISLSDVKNSIGIYVNIDSNITNKGNITINSQVDTVEEGKEQAVNIGMRADGKATAEVINEGNISLDGKYAIGMLSKGSQLKNKGTITSGEVAYGTGIVGIENAKVENNGSVEVLGTGEAHNIGIYLNRNSEGVVGTPKATDPVTQKVVVKGDYSTGVLVSGGSTLSMKGDLTVSGKASSGLVADGTIVKASDGKITVSDNGNSAGALEEAGSYGVVVKGQTASFEGTNVDTDIKVSSSKSIGLYSEGSLSLNKANVVAEEGAFNFYAKGGNITFQQGGTATTGQKSLLFLAQDGGSFDIQAPMTATVKGGNTPSERGNAFLYKGNNYSNFDSTTIGTWANTTFHNTLSNLTLNMEAGSRLFVAQDVSMDLSTSNPNNLLANLGARIEGNDYKTFMLYLSKVTLDENVNLDDVNNAYNKLEITNSSIENKENNQVTGTQAGQVLMAQENDIANAVDKVQLVNKGSIHLSGESSTAIYGKHAEIRNDSTGTIKMGEASAALYGVETSKVSNAGKIVLAKKATALYGKSSTLLNDTTGEIEVRERGTALYGLNGSSIENKGKITLLESASAMYSKNSTTQAMKNSGMITGEQAKSVAMVYEGNNPAAVGTAGRPSGVENTATGKIHLTGDASIGMYGLGTGYTMDNYGEIVLGESSNSNTPSVGMYSASDSVRVLNNAGAKIKAGNNGIGIFAYETANDGSIEVGDNAVAIYSKGPQVELGASSKIKVGKDKAVGVYLEQGGSLNHQGTLEVGENSIGFVGAQSPNAFDFTGASTANVTLGKDAIYLYSTATQGSIKNETRLQSSAEGGNYGIYSAGNVVNKGDIDFSRGLGNVGILTHLGGKAENLANVQVGSSYVTREPEKSRYAVAMGTIDGEIKNRGTINVGGDYSIGMYGKGSNSKVYNYGTINLSKTGAMGIYLDDKAYGENHGTITTVGNPISAIGVVVREGSVLENHGTITINSQKGYTGVLLSGGIIKNYGTMTLNGTSERTGEIPGANKDEKLKTIKDLSDQKTGKELGGVEIVAPKTPNRAEGIYQNGVLVAPTNPNITEPSVLEEIKKFVSIPETRETLTSSIGMYVDTLTPTKPIQGLNTIEIDAADLIIGVEATRVTDSKYIKVSDEKILGPYRKIMINNPQITTWSLYSGALTWMGTGSFDKNGSIQHLYLAKIPYTSWAGDKDTYNFTDGLEQLYGRETWGNRERLVFEKLNSIGNNEETLLYQAYDEMMGHQYANVQQRIHATGGILDKEFRYLRREWANMSKDSNKIKAFGMNGEYKTSTAGIIDYKNYAQGLAYVHEDETVKMGLSSGWYSGFVRNEFKFQDIGKSKEEMYQGKLGYFRNYSYDTNGSLQWFIAGEAFLGHSKLNRRYLVVDDIFKAKSKFWSYGLGLKNEVSKEFRLSEDFKLRPYGMLNLEYGRFQKIREKSGEVRLEVSSNDYYSIHPEVGVELAHKLALSGRNILKTRIGLAYESELGQVGDVKNQARVAHTTADHFSLRGEKDDRKGNVKADLNLGFENTSYGVTANVGYDTKGSNIRAGLGLRVIF